MDRAARSHVEKRRRDPWKKIIDPFAWALAPLLAVSLSLPGPFGTETATAAPVLQEGMYVERMVIVKFATTATESDRNALFEDLGASEIRHLAGLDFYVAQISRRTTAEAIARWEDSPTVEVIEPNGLFFAEGLIPSDPEFSKQWHLRNTGQITTNHGAGTPGADIDVVRAWCTTVGNPDVIVAVLDTGVRWDHPDLASALFVNEGEIAGNGIDDDGNGRIDDIHGWNFGNAELGQDNNDTNDPHGHGTLVAGIIGAAANGVGAVGIAPGVTILPIVVLPNTATSPPRGTHFQAALGIRYATEMGADILNCSFGSSQPSALVREALEEAERERVLVVCAAGNQSRDLEKLPFYPASLPLSNIVSVGGSNPDDNFAGGFSNFGIWSVDLVAPGIDVWGPIFRRTDPFDLYGSSSGTSFAAPQVSGAVALLESFVPGLEYPTIHDLLALSVDRSQALNGLVRTGGRLNVHRLLMEVSDPDLRRPGTVSDLQVVDFGTNWVDLEWTAPGDDDATGTACCYDIRWSDSSLIPDFDAGVEILEPPAPVPGGQTQQIRIDGLEENTQYWFALKASDEAFGVSDPSNEATIVTESAAIRVDMAAFDLQAVTGEEGTFEVDVTNPGPVALDFTVVSEVVWLVPGISGGTLSPDATETIEVAWSASGLWAARHEGTVEIANASRSHIVDVAVSLEVMAAPEIEVSSLTLDLGEVFVGYPSKGTTLIVRNLGFQDLNVTSIDASEPGFSAFPPSFTLLPSTERVLDVTFVPEAMGMVSGTMTIHSDDPFANEVVLDVSGVGVLPPRLDLSAASFLTDGVTGFTPDPVPLTLANLQTGGPNLDASFEVEFAGASTPVWLTLDTYTASVPPAGSADVLLMFSTFGLEPGLLQATIRITTNDPAQLETLLPVVFDVDGIPGLEVSDKTIDFGAVPAGTFLERLFSFTNPGDDTLLVQAEIDGDFAVSPTDLALPPGEVGELTLRYRPPGVSADKTFLRLTTNDPEQPMVAYPAQGSSAAYPVWEGSVGLDRSFVVPAGQTLTIAEGTSIEWRSPPGGTRAGGSLAFEILGGLSIEGTVDDPVTISASGGTVWDGLRISGEAVLRHVEIAGASTGLLVRSGARVEAICASIVDSDVGVEYEGGVGTEAVLSGVSFRNRLVNLRILDGTGLRMSDPKTDRAGRNVFRSSDDPAGGVNIEVLSASIPRLALGGNAWIGPGEEFFNIWDQDQIRATIVGTDPALLPVLPGEPDCDASIFDVVVLPAPENFAFARAMPNPVRDVVPIDYDLPVGFSGRVSVEVYDVRGARVRRVVDEVAETGRHTAIWSLRDDDGRRVTAGVYFLRLRAGEFSRTRKLVVLR